jgi:peptidoglycan/xylan/chitin deacetylase (PgdA/CDA1 family)
MHFFKVPSLLPLLVPSAIWRIKTSEKMIFLTFDDGPQAEVTPWVLTELAKHQAKATFFCVGNNLIREPQIAEEAMLQGHLIANHTLNHSKGWKTSNDLYFAEIEKTSALIRDLYENLGKSVPSPCYFRPPYGRISPSQLRWTQKHNLLVVMWTLLSCDYDSALNCERSLQVLQQHLTSGSIVVFHDSTKAYPQLKQILPAFLAYAVAQGYSFGLLTDVDSAHKSS